MNVYEIRKGKGRLLVRPHGQVVPMAAAFKLPVGRGATSEWLSLRVAMPGVLDEDFSFCADGRTITVSGLRREPEGFGERASIRYALPYGFFHQRILLPQSLDLDKLEAKLHHGVLDIRIPFLLRPAAVAVPVYPPAMLAPAASAVAG